jgi:hypothetical protein
MKLSEEARNAARDACKKRVAELRNLLETIDLTKLEITQDDLVDPYCDPLNPKTINFNDVSAAAYRIKGKIENTPCGVS